MGRKPYSRAFKFANVSSLASYLSLSEAELRNIVDSVDKLWRPGKKLRKKNGEIRQTYDAKPKLKDIHEKIKNRLLKRVCYPEYLLGGIADNSIKRDYKAHAAIHTGKKYLIEEDVKDFFPNTSDVIVKNIWQRFFSFAPETAEILTKLTTLNGMLPQGWKTSSYLANLAFWDVESDLVDNLSNRGITYSRFMDDITVSASHKLDAAQKTHIVNAIYKMLFSRGYSPKRSKHEIVSSAEAMKVTGLIVNSTNPSLPKSERDNIRAAVKQCENSAIESCSTEEYLKMWRSASGRVGKLKRFHINEAEKLRARLNLVRPTHQH